jgi:hypothetical protein
MSRFGARLERQGSSMDRRMNPQRVSECEVADNMTSYYESMSYKGTKPRYEKMLEICLECSNRLNPAISCQPLDKNGEIIEEYNLQGYFASRALDECVEEHDAYIWRGSGNRPEWFPEERGGE